MTKRKRQKPPQKKPQQGAPKKKPPKEKRKGTLKLTPIEKRALESIAREDRRLKEEIARLQREANANLKEIQEKHSLPAKISIDLENLEMGVVTWEEET
jgi:hypothetical protein